MACEFCEQYETNKKIINESNKENVIESKLKVALVAEHYRDRYRIGLYTDGPVELIFCPMCGKKMSETKLDEVTIDEEIKLVNRIIRESIIHGADGGGSYESNEDALINSVNEWLKVKGLFDKYKIKDGVDVGDGWCLHQIIRRE